MGLTLLEDIQNGNFFDNSQGGDTVRHSNFFVFWFTNIEFTLKANLWKNPGDQELINFAKIFTFAQHFAPNWSISHKDVHYKTMKRKGNLPYLLTSNIVTLSDLIYKWM